MSSRVRSLMYLAVGVIHGRLDRYRRTSGSGCPIAEKPTGTRLRRTLGAAFVFVALAPAAAHETISYSYDARGRLVRVAHSGDSNNGVVATATFDAADNRTNYTVTCPTSAVIADASFESPVQSTGGYTYDPVVTGATFSGSAGVTANNSGWNFAPATDGSQVAFLQNVATVSLTVTGLTPGASYNVNFWLAQRTGQINPVTVSANGAALGTYTPTSNSFAPVSTPAFVASASSETLTFATSGGPGDVSSGLDSISVTAGP